MSIEGILSSFVGAFAAAGAVAVLGYWISQYRHRPNVSVRIEVDTSVTEPTIRVVAINRGRAPVVVSELNVYIPTKEAFPDWPSTSQPVFSNQRFFRIRRMLRTPGSKNDVYAILAKQCLSSGAIRSGLILPRETTRIDEQESCSRLFGKSGESGQDKLVKLKSPAESLTLVPSCRITIQKGTIWGPPVVIGTAGDWLWAFGVTSD